jgi:hypothetical protein
MAVIHLLLSNEIFMQFPWGNWIRCHWGIESMHYVMDVVFEEDSPLGDSGESAENMSLIGRLAVKVVRMFDPHRGIPDARRCATYESLYLRGLLGRLFVKESSSKRPGL